MKFRKLLNLKSAKGGESLEFKRYLSKQTTRFEEYIRAAKEYPTKIGQTNYMFFKPFDSTPGNPSYYYLMFDFLSLLKAMQIPFHGAILEVGSGPGWITEILMSLGFEVDAIEPSEDFIQIAQERLRRHIEHHQIKHPSRVTFHATTLEECDLPDESFDAILFYAAMHHIVDEDKGVAQCMRLLKPGGIVGISEAAWKPGDKELEAAIELEMATYHTLENPFTTAYLDHLFMKHGFSEVKRFYQVNGLFEASMGELPIRKVAETRPETHNIIIARRKFSDHPTTANASPKAHAQITLLKSEFNADTHRISVTIKLINDGEVTWLRENYSRGTVHVALYKGKVTGENFIEADERIILPKTILPKEEITMSCVFPISTPESGEWLIDLVNEGFYFFSLEGTKPASFVLD